MQAVIEQSGQLLGSMCFRKIRPTHVPDKQGVASQYRPRLRGFFQVGNHQAEPLRRMSRRFENCKLTSAELQVESILHSNVRESGSRSVTDIDPGSRSGCKLLMPGDKVRVEMGLKNVLDP